MQMALIEIPVGDRVEVGDEVELPVKKTLTQRDIIKLYVQGPEAHKTAVRESISHTAKHEAYRSDYH
jgi:alanine racemase